MRFMHILFLLGVLGLMGACVPEEKSKQVCPTGQVHSVALRTCVSESAFGANGKAPSGVNKSITVNEDTPTNFTLNPGTDADGDILFYTLASAPSHGVVTNCMNLAGSTGLTDISCTYTPAANYYGSDSFTFNISDGNLSTTSPIQISITVSPVNDGPTLLNRYPIMIEDTPYLYTFNYSDTEGNLATSCSIISANHVSAGLCSCAMGVCSVTLTPDAQENSNYAQVFNFYARVSDGTNSNIINEIITVTPVNDLPVISAVSVCTTTIDQDDSPACSAPTATDIDTAETPPQTLSWSLDPTNTCSWIHIASDGTVTGVPTNDDVGTCDFIYKVTDSVGGSTTAAVISFTINNTLPVLTTMAPLITPLEDVTTRQLVGRISSDPGCAESFCLADDSLEFGTLSWGAATTCDANGDLEFHRIDDTNIAIYYTPDANHASSVPCTIEIEYDDGNMAIASVSSNMLVNEVNDPPTMSPEIISPQVANRSTGFAVDADTTTPEIDPIIIDEGGGVDEDVQNLTILIHSSNTALIPHSTNNIKIYSDVAMTSAYNFVSSGVAGVTFDTADGDQDSMYINLIGATGISGNATITVTITDNGTNSGAPGDLSVPKTFNVTINNGFVVHKDWNDIYAVGTKMIHDGTVISSPVVRLGWNAFQATNDTVAGYHIYRSDNISGPFVTPLNSTMIPANARTYTDTSLTDSDSGLTFYYQVRAVSNNYGNVMAPNEPYATLKIPLPLANMSLMHRRMVNYRTCLGMGKAVDINSNNRCSYVGPGDNYSGYYDIGNDYFVDRYEASCNYTAQAGICDQTAGVGCIGNGTPVSALPTPGDVLVTTGGDPAIYYNRADGTCHYFSGISWNPVSSLNAAQLIAFQELNQTKQDGSLNIIESTFPKRPPLVNIQQFKANNYCKSVDLPPALGVAYKTLTSRQIHVAAAEWPSTTTGINALEAGASLSLMVSQCNASNGGNLHFQDGLLGPLYDTWTATEASAFSSHSFVMSGSDLTRNCQSRYGIQDLAGNVEEWNLDRFFYNLNLGAYRLYGIGDNMEIYGSNWAGPMLEASYNPYSFRTSTPALSLYTFLGETVQFSDFSLQDGNAPNTYLYAPFSLPTTSTFPYAVALSTFDPSHFNNDYTYFTSAALNGDNDFTPETGELSGITSGGNFADGTGAGRFTMRFRTACHDGNNDGTCLADAIQANGTEENVYTGFRCMIKLP